MWDYSHSKPIPLPYHTQMAEVWGCCVTQPYHLSAPYRMDAFKRNFERSIASVHRHLKSDFNLFDAEAVAALKGGFVGGLSIYSIQQSQGEAGEKVREWRDSPNYFRRSAQATFYAPFSLTLPTLQSPKAGGSPVQSPLFYQVRCRCGEVNMPEHYGTLARPVTPLLPGEVRRSLVNWGSESVTSLCAPSLSSPWEGEGTASHCTAHVGPFDPLPFRMLCTPTPAEPLRLRPPFAQWMHPHTFTPPPSQRMGLTPRLPCTCRV